jgi:hypothetical protein
MTAAALDVLSEELLSEALVATVVATGSPELGSLSDPKTTEAARAAVHRYVALRLFNPISA